MKRAASSGLMVCLATCLSLALAGCTLGPAATPTPNLPPADEVAFAFLQAWERSDYPVMYSLLSPAAQQKYGEDQFTATYRQVAGEAALLSVAPQIQAAYQSGDHAEISFATGFTSALVGDFETQSQMALLPRTSPFIPIWINRMMLLGRMSI